MKRIQNQKRLKWLAVIVLAVSPLAASAAAEPPVRYKLETKILRSDQMLFPEEENLAVGSIGDDDTLKKLLLEWKVDESLDILTTPSILAAAGQDAVISLQSDVQYLELAKDGSFLLKSLPNDEASGVYLKATPSKVEQKGMVSVDILLRINTLRNREKIPGVSFDVGHPVMQAESIKTKVTIPLTQWMRIETQQLQDIETGEKEYLMIIFKVTPDAAL